jgi:pyroglutamyl-peptidase
MKSVLLTGFEPFGGDRVNASWQAVRELDGRCIGGCRVVARRLPTEFQASLVRLRRLLTRVRPVCVICVGQAAGRAEVTPERVAINVDDARIPDNAGSKPLDVEIVPGGPVGYWTSLPVTPIVNALRRRGIPAAISSSAGTFVCNHVFYGLMHELATRGGTIRGGFVHVPPLARPGPSAGRGKSGEPASGPGWPLPTLVQALRIVVAVSLGKLSGRK